MQQKPKGPGLSEELSRRRLLQLGAAGAALLGAGRASAASPASPDAGTAQAGSLDELGLDELQARMASGEETSASITQKYLDRIAQRDGRLRSVLETNPDALAQAEAMDRERKAGKLRGPLHGIPVLLKDNIATKDRMHTTAGSLALMDATVPADAFLVGRLRQAGAVLLGKTQLSEWANFRSTHSSSGWSGRGGQCRNAYAVDRSPSGSSSGSGVAVSSSLCAVAVGTETDGSIVSPSAVSALVGIKPTVGLVSRGGIVPISHSQDTAGPMARTVRDAALLLEVLAGRDPADAATVAKGPRFDARYSAALDRGALKGARIGVARTKYFGYHPATDALAEKALEVLKAEGAVVVDPANIATAGKIDDPELEVLLYEFKADLEAYLSKLGGTGPRTMKALIEWNQAHADAEMPLFGQELFIDAEKKGPLTTPAYRKARDACIRLSRREGIDATMSKYRLEAIVAPTQGPAWLIDWVNGDSSSGSCTTPAAVSGYPHVTVPMGQIRGLPVGLSFFGHAWSESRLLALAYAYEQATHARKPPTFAASAALPAD
jgi:amidase